MSSARAVDENITKYPTAGRFSLNSPRAKLSNQSIRIEARKMEVLEEKTGMLSPRGYFYMVPTTEFRMANTTGI